MTYGFKLVEEFVKRPPQNTPVIRESAQNESTALHDVCGPLVAQYLIIFQLKQVFHTLRASIQQSAVDVTNWRNTNT